MTNHDDVTRTLYPEDNVRLPPQTRDHLILAVLTIISAVISIVSIVTLVVLCWR